MGHKNKNNWFQKAFILIISAFAFMMILVTFIAFKRTSGSTGLDVTQIHNIRSQALSQDSHMHRTHEAP